MAFEEVTKACLSSSATIVRVSFQDLDSGLPDILDQFYSADAAIVDISLPTQQCSLVYHLGVRQSFGMKNNILLFNEPDIGSAKELRVTIPRILSNQVYFLTYKLLRSNDPLLRSNDLLLRSNNLVGQCIVTDLESPFVQSLLNADMNGHHFPFPNRNDLNRNDLNRNEVLNGSDSEFLNRNDILSDSDLLSRNDLLSDLLSSRICRLLQESEVQTKAHLKEKFINDLVKARESFSGDELKEFLHEMRKRLDDPNIVSTEVVHQLLLAFGDVQDYDANVELIEHLEATSRKFSFRSSPVLLHLYAFSLHRRNLDGDRERALSVMLEGMEEKRENESSDIVCLCGRIYKDRFVESNYKDKVSLNEAITWYRKAFEMNKSEYAGINLATLLVVAGHNDTTELQNVFILLSNLVGRKGSLTSLHNYWDIAIAFELSVLMRDYRKVIQAAECMFKIHPPGWYLKSTIGNIRLINQFRKRAEDAELSPEERMYHFWMEYFIEAAIDDDAEISQTIRFSILILEPNKQFMPSCVTVNLGADEKSLQITNMCLDCLRNKEKCRKPHDWVFEQDMIRAVSHYKRDDRCLYLYVHLHSDDFQMFFSSEKTKKRFHELLKEMTSGEENGASRLTDFEVTGISEISFEYEVDSGSRKVVLGKGTYGVVYAAFNTETQVEIAVKEIPIKNMEEVQPLEEEIKLHSQLKHRNIVQYMGSRCEENKFKILMERVPGGSLSWLIANKWGALPDPSIAFYSKQMLEGLKYLHGQKIVHRDIKGDNVLINTFTGVLKISDFGTSKRLAGLNPRSEAFTGTWQYMAPEVIEGGTLSRGYGASADIWSFGCTAVEMATGEPPFMNRGSGPEIIFLVGQFKEHPSIPESLSLKAKQFILRCFEPDQGIRATAVQLLEDPFLVSETPGRKKNKSSQSVSASSVDTGPRGFERHWSQP